jgi:hypothetical protein
MITLDDGRLGITQRDHHHHLGSHSGRLFKVAEGDPPPSITLRDQIRRRHHHGW